MADAPAAAPTPAPAAPKAAAAPAKAQAAPPVIAARPNAPSVIAPAADVPGTVAKAKAKGDRHAEIKAKLAASQPATETPPADGETPTPEPTKPTEPEPKKPAVGAVMRLTAENTKLKGDLEAAHSKLEAASKGESLEALRERIKKDPAVLFDVFGAELGEDEGARLAKLNDAVLDRADPTSVARREAMTEVDKLKAQLAARDAEVAKVAAEQRDSNARAHTAKVLTEGHKADDGTLVIDPAKFPYINHLTKTGEVDAHAGVMHATRDLAAEFRKEQKREPNDAEIATMIGIAAVEAEAYFSKRAKNWTLPQLVPTEQTPAPTERKTPTTIGSQFGRRSPGLVDASHLTKAERHEAIRQRLRSSANTTN